MPDHWSFVVAAYALAAVALAAYWRRLVHRDRELSALERRRAARGRSLAAPDAVRR
jgi:heme exporter protein D